MEHVIYWSVSQDQFVEVVYCYEKVITYYRPTNSKLAVVSLEMMETSFSGDDLYLAESIY